MGISAGAQFAHRFALLYPVKCKAVAAHAAGGYNLPHRKVRTRFLITVGDRDNKEISRVDFAVIFVKACQKKNINAQLKILQGIGHWQTPQQNEMSRQFFVSVKNSLSS